MGGIGRYGILAWLYWRSWIAWVDATLAATAVGQWIQSHDPGWIVASLATLVLVALVVPLMLITVVVIALGSALKMAQLSGGGKAVADMVGARRVLPETSDPLERRLINVVEEMAIASGTPMPRLYVMDEEQGINAFVAGLKAEETVLVVTRGCLEQLNRQELQGVIGHEYSHIMHADMRPFAPWSDANPFLHRVSLGALHWGCVAAAVLGGLLWVVFLRRNRKRV